MLMCVIPVQYTETPQVMGQEVEGNTTHRLVSDTRNHVSESLKYMAN